VNYKDLPRFTLGKDTFLCEGEKLILAPVLNGSATYVWQDGSTDNFFTVDRAGIYKLTTYNECGSYSDSITITNGVCNLIMPTAFTPNGDGLNDVFRVKYPFTVKQFKMEIYNRWGEKVFESQNITDGWNGNFGNNQAIASIYVWVISFTDMSDEIHQLKGTITLIR
jgi:gliding motility-associated-like protein